MYDIIVIGGGIAGSTFASKASKYANTLLIEARDKVPATTNVFPLHNQPFIQEIDWKDKEIFPDLHLKTNYKGYNVDGIINAEEFGAPLGNMTYLEQLIKKLLQNCEDQGGTVKTGERVNKVTRKIGSIEVYTNKENLYSGRILVIATGSHSFELQKSLGFEVPRSYTGAFTHLYGEQHKIEELCEWNYIYHVNPKISKSGPLFINRGVERVEVGYLGNVGETHEQILSKLNRILNNYKLIQPYIKDLKPKMDPIVVSISKHAIKKLTQDRVLILGEAGGLVTDFFYEGTLCGVASADIAAKTLKSLLEKESNFTHNELLKYETELKRILLNKYFKNGNASEYLFFNAGKSIKLLWDTYTKLISLSERLRRDIWEAYRIQDIENYNLAGTKWAGESLFRMLPTLSKIALGTKFFRALFK
jgi:flavin-dependent dehydrogenase